MQQPENQKTNNLSRMYSCDGNTEANYGWISPSGHIGRGVCSVNQYIQ
jgi:hypothetical protein